MLVELENGGTVPSSPIGCGGGGGDDTTDRDRITRKEGTAAARAGVVQKGSGISMECD